MIRAFEAFAITDVGKEWIASRAQEGFSQKFVHEKGGINIKEAGDMSAVVDYNFSVGGDTKNGIGLTEYNTEGSKLEVNITFDSMSAERSPTDVFSFTQLSDAVFYETNFHGFLAEETYMTGETDPSQLSSGDHNPSDLNKTPYGDKAFSYYLYLVNRPTTKTMKGYEKYSKRTGNSTSTYSWWWREYMGQFGGK